MAAAVRSVPGNSHPLYFSLVSSISAALQNLKSQNPTQSLFVSPLNQFSQSLNPNLIIDVVKSQTDPQLALHFFYWASNQNPRLYSHTPKCYSAIVDLLLSHNMFFTAEKLLVSNKKFSDFLISKFIKAYGNRGDIRGAIHWFHRVDSLRIARGVYSYNALLGILVRNNKIKLAQALFNRVLEEKDLIPDVSTYTTIIRGYCKLGMIEDAKKVFEGMICRPNLITYNTMMNGFCRKGLMQDAREILNIMIRTKDCQPDTITFSTLIDGYCKQGEIQAAMDCMNEMEKWNCEPNNFTYNSLIHGLCLIGEVNEAKKFTSKMLLNGWKADASTYTSILKGLCLLGRMDEAAKQLKEMDSSGLKLDAESYVVMVNAYCKRMNVSEAKSLLEQMTKKGIIPHVSCFNALFRALCHLNDFETAIQILKQMTHMGCHPNFSSYSIIISGLCKIKRRMQDVEELVVQLVQRGHQLDTFTYNEIVKGYCENRELHMAVGMYKEMIQKGFVISLTSFSVLVGLSAIEGKTVEIQKLFEEMCRKHRVVADIEGYRRILDNHYCKS